jgi:hypothetical protein|nr:MAG TPA: major capsid protein [Caudoviricetes sp.]
MEKFDFSGWATKANLKCSDGRVIMKDAFKHNDGQRVPLVWNHQHNNPEEVLGHALLENRDEGVYAYCSFNDSESAQTAKLLVQHGDIVALSIYANQLKQNMSNVLHGNIREVSLVLAGANPGASIDSVMMHGEESDEEGIIYTGEELSLAHASEDELEHSNEEEKKENKTMAEETKTGGEKTVADVFNSFTEEQKTVVYAMIGQALEDAGVEDNDENDEDEMNHSEGGNNEMKHNVFDQDGTRTENVLTHSDMNDILELSKNPSVGSFKQARKIYEAENELQHDAFDEETMNMLLPEYKLIDPAEPKILYPDDTWVSSVINGVHKSPYSRVRTRRADARQAELQALGYKKGDYKKEGKQIKLLGRTHDAQTIYVKDKINRDDVLDITEFDIIAYQWKILRHTMDQTLATAILIGDGRDDLDPDKIKEDHIRPIWKDDDMYCIHQDVDIAAAKTKLQGTNTGAYFGDNYIYAEAIIEAALYSREQYKGSGNLTFYCTPHLLNVMLLARDLNGRRIYSSKADLVAALNVRDIQTIEQFEGLTRTAGNKTKKLLGLFVNLADYQLGCVKGGEITRFEDFDIDFNQHKLLLETRVSGALVEWYSAIALEEDVTDGN